MKKLLGVFAVCLLLLLAVGVYLLSNLDGIVKSLIESVGSDTLGTTVSVEEVAIDLRAGQAAIRGLNMANPAGFSDRNMLSLGELAVALDLARLSGSFIAITSIRISEPVVVYESRDGRSNFDVINARLATGNAGEQEAAAGAEPELQIDDLQLANIQATLSDDRLPRELNLNLGNIVLQNLNGSPEQVARQALRPVLAQISRTAADALTNALRARAEELLESRAAESLNDLQQQVTPRLEEALESSRDGLRNLLQRN